MSSSVSSSFSMFNPNEELKIFFQNDFREITASKDN